MKIIFYTRNRCPLCTDAKLILQQLQKVHQFQIIERDIETNDEWTEKYGLMIPVVEINEEIVQYGMIDPITIEEKIDHL
ncbi:glutaredoxin family protein [Bacillus sp. FJAT-49711]|uniref:glutaredoxin family protein n=1 Tax=Bacillus sp. FJAT-49711 TaxID=2833585 RepID=UPI001BCA1C9D|nr:glutaredoxin family protein [Bacillus sp. FJAT-49711]MBS4219417.1 glutaredoxin family protein [Bacillus sp. FJAT-49711]